jgi:hypothetical protein
MSHKASLAHLGIVVLIALEAVVRGEREDLSHPIAVVSITDVLPLLFTPDIDIVEGFQAY